MLRYRIPFLSLGHLKISVKKLIKIIKTKPVLWPLWVVFGVVTFFVLVWLPNVSMLTSFLLSSASLELKAELLTTTPQVLFSTHSALGAVLLIFVSVLQGLLLSLATISVMYSKSNEVASVTAGVSGVTAAAIGSGCSACGASIIYPMLVSLGLTSSGAISSVGTVLMMLALLVLLYSIHLVLMKSTNI